ncbi:hypothetical protein BpHYR1_054515 [Brachionus plicatilis]|uniref:Uncharacterized protein n=1 Tax=Brachionus plicatilis TaxID=10195 RepID=A0A3M7S2U2_BRAPC|nr:hypothetical protein BpHYR1_054515 [Brachionus plicatilis]
MKSYKLITESKFLISIFKILLKKVFEINIYKISITNLFISLYQSIYEMNSFRISFLSLVNQKTEKHTKKLIYLIECFHHIKRNETYLIFLKFLINEINNQIVINMQRNSCGYFTINIKNYFT